jgi:hypothetical protein
MMTHFLLAPSGVYGKVLEVLLVLWCYLRYSAGRTYLLLTTGSNYSVEKNSMGHGRHSISLAKVTKYVFNIKITRKILAIASDKSLRGST